MVNPSAFGVTPPRVERWSCFDEILGTKLWVAREDLLPFPLAGNKVRKIAAELDTLGNSVDAIITNGGVDSNHCRTLAFYAARLGISAHLVLHGDDRSQVGLQLLKALGATYDVGSSDSIRDRIINAQENFLAVGKRVHIISGGGHTPEGAIAFRKVGEQIFRERDFDQVFLASGTGATQGGLIAASEFSVSRPDIVGISIARTEERGMAAVAEAAKWAGSEAPKVVFSDRFRAGGYGASNNEIAEAVRLGWSHGLPLDETYTGKAFTGLLEYGKSGNLGESVLFWHTGGLWNWMASRSGVVIR